MTKRRKRCARGMLDGSPQETVVTIPTPPQSRICIFLKSRPPFCAYRGRLVSHNKAQAAPSTIVGRSIAQGSIGARKSNRPPGREAAGRHYARKRLSG
jgi:hypothetical protein